MSLINDALSRARAEAARREAEERGENPAPLAAPERSARLSPAIWAAGAVILLALLAWLWQFGDPQATEVAYSEPAGAQPPRTQPASIEPPSTEAPSAGLPSQGGAGSANAAAQAPSPTGRSAGIAEPAPEVADSAPGAARPRARREPSPAAPDERPETLASPVPETTTPADSAPVSPPSTSSPPTSPAAVWPADGAGDETWYYVGAMAVPGGGRIELGGIAWSPTAPSAMLNGSLLGVGDEILGLTVSDIGPRTVVFTGRGQRIALQLGGGSRP